MRSLDESFAMLRASAFRRKFVLRDRELAYLQTWGLKHVMKQAAEILAKRVAAAEPRNDGRQTPWRNHPVFVAQHATATCCRACIENVHGIAKGHALTPDETARLLAAIERWLSQYLAE
jgi:2-iminoacetate synthase ThiH